MKKSSFLKKAFNYSIFFFASACLATVALVGNTNKVNVAKADTITDLTGCTWVGNDAPSADGHSKTYTYNINFTSNSVIYSKLELKTNHVPQTSVYYDSTMVYGSINWNMKWADSAYKTIVFDATDAGTAKNNADLIAWLNTNGTLTPAAGSASVTSVSLNKNSSSIEVGSTEQLTATVSPDNASDKSVSWSSSNEAIATVSSTGLVTGVTAGSATITVTSNSDNTKTASCEFTVTSGADEPTSSASDSYTKIIINSSAFALTTLKLSNFTFESGYSLTNLNNYYKTYYGTDPVNNIGRNTTTRGYGLTDSDSSIVLCYGGNGGTYIYHVPSWVTGCEPYLWYNGYLNIPLGNINNLYAQTSNGTGSGSAGSGVNKIITVQFNQWNLNSTISVSNNFYASKDYPMVVNAWNDVNNFFVSADVGLYCWSDYPLFSARTVKVTQLGSGQLGYTILPKGTEYFKVVKAGSGLLPCSGRPSSVSNEWGTLPFDSTKNVVTVKYYSGDQEYNEYRELLIQGMPVMFDTAGEIQSWWFGDGNRFFINVDGITQDYYGYTSSDAWFELTRIGQTGYMYYVPTTTVLCTRVIVTRNSSSGSGWNNKYNQTTDMTTNYGFNPLYTTQVLSSTTDGKQNWSPLGATETASEFGCYFMDKITCNNGVTAPNVTNWNATKTFYDGLTSDVQDTASNAIVSESGNNIQQAVARYDYIVRKYGSSTYNDYLVRNPSATSNGALFYLLSIKGNSVSTIIIILSSTLAILAVGGYFYLRKKKKEY